MIFLINMTLCVGIKDMALSNKTKKYLKYMQLSNGV